MRVVFEKLLVKADYYELNPLLEPEKNSQINIIGVSKSGEENEIKPEEVKLSVSTVMTSGDAPVAAVDETGCITPLEGGIARIKAEIVKYGHGASGSCDIIVRPFYHEYHKTLTLKFFLGMDDIEVAHDPRKYKNDFYTKDCDIMMTFEEVLENVKRIDNITYGMPKIVYLVGWQKGGHDHGYPDFNEVNPKLKRDCDKTAAESLRWLIREGFKYNTSISLHINVNSSYSYSSLYEEYKKLGILMNDKDYCIQCKPGLEELKSWRINPALIGAEPVIMTPFWETGAFKQRMDELLKMLPELVDSHTIHFDNWGAMEAPHQGVTKEDDENAIRNMFHYMREKGLDITSEGSYHGRTDPMAGLQPMSWWDPPAFLPNSLYCGGRGNRYDDDPRFGDSTLLECTLMDNYYLDRHPAAGVQNEFCLYTLPWHFLNYHRLLDFDGVTATYTGDVVATIEKGIPVIRQGDITIRRGTTLFVPVLWKDKREIMGYSLRSGYIHTKLPKDWQNVESVDFYDIDEKGERPPMYFHSVPVKDEYIDIHLRSRQAYILKPDGAKES